MDESANIAQYKLMLDGAQVSPAISVDVTEIVVDMAMGVPDMITVTLYDEEHIHLDGGSSFTLGKILEVGFIIDSTQEPGMLAKGEIIAVEPDLSPAGSTRTTIRAYNKMNRLHHGRATRTFLNVKDSDIASTIAQEAGLSATVDATTTTHEYVVQWNQTNMEFLAERARRNGYSIWADKTNLFFKKIKPAATAVAQLTYGESLTGFRPRMTLAQQVTGTSVHGWDPKQKREVVGTGLPTQATSPAALAKKGSAWAGTIAPGSKLTVTDSLVLTQNEAQAYAVALAEELNRDLMDAEADCYGNPAIVPGAMVQISNVGTVFNGKYYVTAVQHRYDSNGYSCHLSLSGSHPVTINGLVGGQDQGQKVYGVLPAVITNVNDPDKKGRVKVKFVTMPLATSGTAVESFWVRVVSPLAGKSRGFFFMPEVNDEVLIAFEGGEPARGYVIGSLWNGVDAPPLADYLDSGGSKVDKRVLHTRSGHKFTFVETAGSETITLEDKAGNKLLLDAANKKVALTSVGDMDITVQGNLKISTTGNFTSESKGNFAVDSKGSVGVKSVSATTIESLAGLTIKANGALSVQGMSVVEVKANATLSLSASAMAELKGALVKIN